MRVKNKRLLNLFHLLINTFSDNKNEINNNVIISKLIKQNNKRIYIISLLAVPIYFLLAMNFLFLVNPSNEIEIIWRRNLIVSQCILLFLFIIYSIIFKKFSNFNQITIKMKIFQIVFIYSIFSFGIIVTVIDQLVTSSITPFIIVCFLNGILIFAKPKISLINNFVAYMFFYFLIGITQNNQTILTSNRVNGIVISGIGVALSTILWQVNYSNIKQKIIIENQNKEISTKAMFQKVISEISFNFINVGIDNIKYKINEALIETFDLIKANQIILGEVDPEKNTIINVFEFYRQNHSRTIFIEKNDNIKSIKFSEIFFSESVKEKNNVGELQPDFILPLVKNNKIFGILAVYLSKDKPKLLKDEIEALKIIGNIFSDAFLKINIDNSRKIAEMKIIEKNKELEKYNNKITSSINYAKKIQYSILPKKHELNEIFNDYFVIWKPKDIVGGDFFWINRLKEGFLVSVIDCTGHGVPGALMAMTTNAVLNRIVDSCYEKNPSKILKELNIIMKKNLHNENVYKKNVFKSDDGLDIAMCYVVNNKLYFSGAGISLYYRKDDKITRIIPNRQGIGYSRSKQEYNYDLHEIIIHDNNSFYLTTDGYLDQNDNKSNKRFGRNRFIQMIEENMDKSLSEQKEIYENELLNHQGNELQRDDITFIGFSL